jgi:hypothetical protein
MNVVEYTLAYSDKTDGTEVLLSSKKRCQDVPPSI